MLKLTDLSRVTIISTAETALKRLKNANVGVYNCKKEGAKFIFSIKDKDLKKVFAIFSKPCYNISVQSSRRKTLASFAVARIGLAVGGLLFVCVAAVCNSFIFKIEVCGSGSYLVSDVKGIIYEQGFSEFKAYRSFDPLSAESKILALPSVTFCSLQKRGSVLRVEVRADRESGGTVNRATLKADKSGVVRNIVVVCGTAAVEKNNFVNAGDDLIYAYALVGDERTDCIAVGYAEIECRASYEYTAPEECDEAEKAAYSKANLYAENILERTHTVTATDGGVCYKVEYTYLRKLSINME